MDETTKSGRHQVIRRGRTLCGMRIALWDDGLITTGLGGLLPKVGAARLERSVEANLWAGAAVMEMVSTVTFEELPSFVLAARKLARARVEAGESCDSLADVLDVASKALDRLPIHDRADRIVE